MESRWKGAIQKAPALPLNKTALRRKGGKGNAALSPLKRMLTTGIFYPTEDGSRLQCKVYLWVAEVSLRCQSNMRRTLHQKCNLHAVMSEIFQMHVHHGGVRAGMWKSMELGYGFFMHFFTTQFKIKILPTQRAFLKISLSTRTARMQKNNFWIIPDGIS